MCIEYGKIRNCNQKICKSNKGKADADFKLFKKPEDLYKQFGADYTLNKFKGDILEILLEELFLGNGYGVKRLGEGGKDGGCDLLIKYPHDNSIRFVLQAKNWNKNIDKYDVMKEHHKFTDNYKGKYNLNNTHFCFVLFRFKTNSGQLIFALFWSVLDCLHYNYTTIIPHPLLPLDAKSYVA